MAAGVLVAVLMASACSQDSEPVPSSTVPITTPSALPAPATPSAAVLRAPPVAAVEVVEEEYPSVEPVPTWDEAARAAAVEHARAMMTAFARPDLPAQQWWGELAPLLTLSAQDAYAAVDPAEVPARQVTAAPVLTDDSSAWLARLDVPTDVGTYALLLAREDGAAPWLTEQITPPPALSQPVGP